MTMPRGYTVNPLDQAARDTIRTAQHLLAPAATSALPAAARPALTDQEKRDAGELVSAGKMCAFCAGLHVGASTPACPRLAAGKVNGDGIVTEFSFWPDGQWDTSRIVFVADVAEDVDEDGKEPT